jgi:hypothetical protein
MDPFVRRLVERLHDPAKPLSRNRHFHTFDNPLGKAALKVSRMLTALQKDIAQAHAAGIVPTVLRVDDGENLRIEVKIPRLKGTRSTRLDPAEFELLCALPGMREALKPTR